MAMEREGRAKEPLRLIIPVSGSSTWLIMVHKAGTDGKPKGRAKLDSRKREGDRCSGGMVIRNASERATKAPQWLKRSQRKAGNYGDCILYQ